MELKEFCDQNNKRLILFTPPKSANECNDDSIGLEQSLGKMGSGYYDYTNLFQENYLDYWKDRIHLSGKGAEIFSKKFQKRLSDDNVPYFFRLY